MMSGLEEVKDYDNTTWVHYLAREFIASAADELRLRLRHDVEGVANIGMLETMEGIHTPALKPGDVILHIDPCCLRPAEANILLGDPSKARQQFGWEMQINACEMRAAITAEDVKVACRYALLKEHGMNMLISIENT